MMVRGESPSMLFNLVMTRFQENYNPHIIYDASCLGKPTCKKSEVFLNIVQKALTPPPFYLNICPILQGVLFKRVFEH